MPAKNEKFDEDGFIRTVIKQHEEMDGLNDEIVRLLWTDSLFDVGRMEQIEGKLREMRGSVTAMIDRIGCAKMMMAEAR